MKKSKIIKRLKAELKFKDECLKDASAELINTCKYFNKYTKTLENQLEQQDKALEYKDLQFL